MTVEQWAMREATKLVHFDEDYTMHIGATPLPLKEALSSGALLALRMQIAQELVKAYQAGTNDTVAAALA